MGLIPYLVWAVGLLALQPRICFQMSMIYYLYLLTEYPMRLFYMYIIMRLIFYLFLFIFYANEIVANKAMDKT